VAQFALFAAVLLDSSAAWLPLAVLSAVLGAGAATQYALRAWKLTRQPA